MNPALLEMVQIFTRSMESVEELEIWLKYMKPVWHERDSLKIKQALLSAYQEAADKKVLRGNSTVEELVRFLL